MWPCSSPARSSLLPPLLLLLLLLLLQQPHLVRGQTIAARLAGTYSLAFCENQGAVVPGAGCGELYSDSSSYQVKEVSPHVYQDRRARTATGGGNQSHSLSFVVDPLTGLVTLDSPYECVGAMGKLIRCYDSQDDEALRLEFYCETGDCVTTIVQQNMRSFMYPVLGILCGLVWFIWPFVGGAVSATTLVTGLNAGQVFVGLMLLFTPASNYGLLLMAASSFSFNALKAAGPWEIKLSCYMGAFVFLSFSGFNSLFAGSNLSAFDVLMNSFNSGYCHAFYGIALDEARCGQFLLFSGFLTYLATCMIPLSIIGLLWVLVQEENGN